jgi:hypothetical protein
MDRFDEDRRLSDESLESQVRDVTRALLAETQPREPVQLAA